MFDYNKCIEKSDIYQAHSTNPDSSYLLEYFESTGSSRADKVREARDLKYDKESLNDGPKVTVLRKQYIENWNKDLKYVFKSLDDDNMADTPGTPYMYIEDGKNETEIKNVGLRAACGYISTNFQGELDDSSYTHFAYNCGGDVPLSEVVAYRKAAQSDSRVLKLNDSNCGDGNCEGEVDTTVLELCFDFFRDPAVPTSVNLVMTNQGAEESFGTPTGKINSNIISCMENVTTATVDFQKIPENRFVFNIEQ